MTQVIEWGGHKVDVDRGLMEITREECEESLTVFLMHAWRFIDPAPFKSGWVIDALAEHLEAVADGDIRRLCINVPPRCSKSSIISVAFPAWVWAQSHKGPISGPSASFLCASYAHSLALRDSVKCRRLIKSTWYQKMWGAGFQIVGDQDMKIRFQNNKGGERLITSVSAGVTGEGADCIIVDDPTSATEVMSEAVIQSTNEDWWDGAMSTRLNDPKTGAYIVVQQRLGENDLTGHILANDKSGEWCHLMLPMEFEPERSFVTSIGWQDPRVEPGELLWPERFGHEEVQRLKNNLGSWRGSGQLQQRPEPKGGGVIKRDWWKLWPPEGELFNKKGEPVKPLQNPGCSFIVASLDTAYTEKTINDPSALTIWGVFAGDPIAQEVRASDEHSVRVYTETSTRVILLHAWAKHLEIHALVNEVAKSCKTFNVDKLLIEDKAAGHSVAQELRRLFSNEPWAVQLINPKNLDKLARLYSVQHLFEEGMIYAPERTWSEMVISEVATFPNGKRDDLTDTVSQALRHLRDIGLLQRGVEITADVTEAVRHTGRPPERLYPS